MSDTSWTPGPWRTSHDGHGAFSVETDEPAYSRQICYVRNSANARLVSESPMLAVIAEGVLTALKYPRGSEAQIRCLEEVAQDAQRSLARIAGDA
jgi:hypothetical protein